MDKNVSIATKPLVYSAFRYINNKIWNAIAEYIDNAIQSYLDHKEVLSQINPNGTVQVCVDFDFVHERITITDNAFGITEKDYQRAFELANIPLDANGLNEFGMGMKVSSIWLSDIWTVETSAYGEDIRKTLCFDVNEVVKNEQTELPVTVSPAQPDEHYTKITLTKLSLNKPSSRQLSYIKKHLESIYTEYLREGCLELIVNGEQLTYKDLAVLHSPYYKTPNGEPILWKQEFDFKAPNPKGGFYIAKGFVALLETMSTSTDNGFLLFRRGRVIGSSYEDRYRPECLCGPVGSPRYKRVFGEIHLEGFDVSFTKNSFQEDDDFAVFIKMLRDSLAAKKTFDIFGQAQSYIKPKSPKEKKDVGTKLIKTIADTISSPIDLTPKGSESNPNPPSTTPQNHTSEQPNTDNTSPVKDSTESSINDIQPITTSFNISSDKKITLEIRCEYGSSIYSLYSLVKKEDRYVSVINLKNHLFVQYEDLLSKNEGIEIIAHLIKTMVASEIVMQEEGCNYGTYFRDYFNRLCGQV